MVAKRTEFVATLIYSCNHTRVILVRAPSQEPHLLETVDLFKGAQKLSLQVVALHLLERFVSFEGTRV
jgi:hypothetical protein